MPDRPLLLLPAPTGPTPREKRRPRFGPSWYPSRGTQAERLDRKFHRLTQALGARTVRAEIVTPGLVPEEVVVLETVDGVENFIRAVERVPGMEWVAEIEQEDLPADDSFFATALVDGRVAPKDRDRRLFMVFTDQRALREMLSLWERWKANQTLDTGLAPWGHAFQRLVDVRPWDQRDRLIDTGILEDWAERLELQEELLPCEIELWFRSTSERRAQSRQRVAALVEDHGGYTVTEAEVEEIAYNAMMVYLPAKAIEIIVENVGADLALLQCEQIQFFRPSAQLAVSVSDGDQTKDVGSFSADLPVAEPVVALLDGLPLQAHRRIRDRIVVDDPDDFGQNYPAAARRHGTAMASLIIHGDLSESNPPLPSKLYVRPILLPDEKDFGNNTEAAPYDVMVVDLLHRAVRDMLEGDGVTPANAPHIAIINLSFGIRDRPFDRNLSPLARLLDWLAWHYKVVFVVSAGNHVHSIQIPSQQASMATSAQREMQRAVLRAVASDARHRRLLSPAESVNALTVGAIHDDQSTGTLQSDWRDPYSSSDLPSPFNGQGMGYRRAIKPDVLAPGGRVLVRPMPTSGKRVELEMNDQKRRPGQLVAAPGTIDGDESSTWYARGTSNATALVSREAAFLHEVLVQLRGEPGGQVIDTLPMSVWLKAMIVHGASWGSARAVLDDALRDSSNSRMFREYLTRLLGYGGISSERVRECTRSRVTVLGGGWLGVDKVHEHRFPLPASLSGVSGYRCLTITLAWLSPVNPRHRAWRRASLRFSPPKEELSVDRREADYRAVLRGTVQHEVLDGKRATFFVDGSELAVMVECRAAGGVLEEQVPYAIVATLEVDEGLGIDIYDEVRVAVHATQVRVTTSA